MSWILFTFLAAFSQAWRNAFQSQLSKTLNVTGVTLARFLWASPLALIYLVALYQWQPTDLPTFTGHSWFFLVGASIMQIVATALIKSGELSSNGLWTIAMFWFFKNINRLLF